MLVSPLKNNFFKLCGLVYVPGLVLLLCLPGLLRAQSKLTISGIVKDSTTGEALIGATIKTGQNGGVITNSYGFYSLTVSPSTYTLLVSYIGYKTKPIPVNIDKNTRLDIELTADNALSEINVTAKTKAADNVLGAQMGVNKLSMSDIANIPVLLGEKDIIKTIELLPGVKSTGDANTGFYVRGGNADENLILLDGATVYNASHLFGFFSTFNSDAIREVSLYKGGMFAGYGGRLSSVLDIKMDEGNNKQYGVEGGIGLISSRIKIEGPIVKNKSSFMISARRTYADVFLKLSSDTSINTSSLYFYDVNAKVNYQLDDKNTLYLSAYLGKDDVAVKNTFATDWGNTTATLRWNHVFSGKLFSNTSFIYSKYNYNIANYDADNDIEGLSD